MRLPFTFTSKVIDLVGDPKEDENPCIEYTGCKLDMTMIRVFDIQHADTHVGNFGVDKYMPSRKTRWTVMNEQEIQKFVDQDDHIFYWDNSSQAFWMEYDDYNAYIIPHHIITHDNIMQFEYVLKCMKPVVSE